LHIKGLVTPVEPWMAACDCIVAPAIKEPLGRTPLEASAMNVPVVASNDGGHVETIIHGVTGFLVEKDNKNMFCEKILQVLQGALRNDESCHARKKLLQTYDPESHAKLVMNVYSGLLKRSII
jgi:glycosyltransferase involved in cell wall biosynthesis